MKVIALLNEKGGVGKTTLAATIAAGLAMRGYKTLLIDADPQDGAATVTVGLRPSPGLYDWLVLGADFEDVARPVEYCPGEMLIVPGDVDTGEITREIESLTFRNRLREVIGVDVVVIDTSPTPSSLHLIIHLATDYVLYPTMLEYLSFRSLQATMQHVGNSQAVRERYELPPIRQLGIVPMMYRDVSLHQVNLETLENSFADIWEPIRERIAWGEASGHHQSIFVYAPRSAAAKEAILLIDRVEKGLELEL